ncbi:MAG: cytochrome P450 [Roseobacter sp.]
MRSLSQSPLEDDFVQNPYALYAEILSADVPVRFWRDYDRPAVFGAAEIQTLLRDPRLGRAVPETLRAPCAPHLADFAALEKVSMLELEPPAHTRLRGLVLRAFTSRRIKTMAPNINAICTDLIGAFPNEPFDLLSAYCQALPVRIIARLLGVPEAMWPELLRWSNAMVAMYQAGRTHQIETAANTAASEFSAFLSDFIDARHHTPQDDLLSELILAEAEGKRLSRQEMIGTCILLLNAGHEATVHTLGNAVKTILENNTPRDALSDHKIPTTIEEVLRFDPPLHLFSRDAYDTADFGAFSIRRGEEVALILGAAGRDPRLVERPDHFDPYRKAPQHSAFGGGIHFCVGAPLARLELQIGLQRLMNARPSLKIVTSPRYANSFHLHGLENLMVTA